MNSMTLREICMKTGVGRRAIQGYEKAGLVRPSGKNKYGYLLYDEKAEERIEEIFFLQQIGFPVKEIALIIDSSDKIKRAALERQLEVLRRNSEKLAYLILKTEETLESLKTKV